MKGSSSLRKARGKQGAMKEKEHRFLEHKNMLFEHPLRHNYKMQ